VLAVADAPVLSRMSDGVLLVVDSGQTKRERAQRTKEALEQAGARLLGIILNRMDPSRTGYSYNYKYYASTEEKSPGRPSVAPSSSGPV
jgi:Mrp family chromosome partitioning ATPase